MNKKAPIGIDNFAELIDPHNNYCFVDRTLALNTLLDDGQKVIAFHTFRRCGKSLFVSMLHYFFSAMVNGISTQGLFDNLALGQQAPEKVLEHQGKYPVVMLSLKDAKGLTFNEGAEAMWRCVREAYRQHEYLLTSDKLNENDIKSFRLVYDVDRPLNENDLKESLFALTALLYKHYHNKKVWVIIDEYDAPVTTAYRHGYLETMLPLVKSFLSRGLKSNSYLERGVLIGILRIAKDSLLSGLNNPKIITLLDPDKYRPYFGFTEEEVFQLLADTGLQDTVSMDAIKSWYNGYRIGGQSLYNPWSIMNCIDSQGALGAYWDNTSDDNLLKDSLLNAPEHAQQDFEALITGTTNRIQATVTEKIQFDQLTTRPNALWGLLLSTGYLTPKKIISTDKYEYNVELKVPNAEIKRAFSHIFMNLFEQVSQGQQNQYIASILDGDIALFTELVQEYLDVYASMDHLKYEGCYHSLVLGLLHGLSETCYVYSGTLTTGRGVTDLLVVPKESQHRHAARLFEFKRLSKGKTVEQAFAEAFTQIDEQRYTQYLKQHPYINAVTKVAMVFVKKHVFAQHNLETL